MDRRPRTPQLLLAGVVVLALNVVGCSPQAQAPPPTPVAVPAIPTVPEVAGAATTVPSAGSPPDAVASPTPAGTPAPPPLPEGVSRPSWLGTRPLPLDADGQAIPQPTPEELVVRRIPTVDLLPPPPPDAPYRVRIEPLGEAVAARSTWTPECPVAREELAYLTVSFWGFDDRPHTGELIVAASWAEEVGDIFGQLFAARYPIEEMRIVAPEEMEGVPTGDGNVTTGFVCRPVRGGAAWSAHALGLAIDVNPFINPYRRGERILPELAEAYLDRSHVRPGMVDEGSVVVAAFDAIGWGWGGRWQSLVDHMHFSATNR